jgi:hypothetical protein
LKCHLRDFNRLLRGGERVGRRVAAVAHLREPLLVLRDLLLVLLRLLDEFFNLQSEVGVEFKGVS